MAQEKGSSKTEQKKLSNAENNCPAETTRENEQTSTDIYDSVRLTDWYVMSLEKVMTELCNYRHHNGKIPEFEENIN